MPRIHAVATCLALSLTVACAPAPEARDHSADVDRLAEDAWNHLLERSPYLQNRQGTLVTEFPDLTEEQAAADVEWARSMLARIEAIPLEELSHGDALTLECLR